MGVQELRDRKGWAWCEVPLRLHSPSPCSCRVTSFLVSVPFSCAHHRSSQPPGFQHLSLSRSVPQGPRRVAAGMWSHGRSMGRTGWVRWAGESWRSVTGRSRGGPLAQTAAVTSIHVRHGCWRKTGRRDEGCPHVPGPGSSRLTTPSLAPAVSRRGNWIRQDQSGRARQELNVLPATVAPSWVGTCLPGREAGRSDLSRSCRIYSPANPARFAQSKPGPSLPHLPNPNPPSPSSPSSFPMAATHRRTGSSNGVGGTSQPRQLPGSACEECRKRKLRCKNDST
jgi:hypothetical protein